MDEIQLPTLYPKQHAVFYAPERTVICEATTKAGKSIGCIHWLLHEGMTSCKGQSMLWLASVYSQAEVMYRRLIRMLERADPDRETGWSVRAMPMQVTVPGGAVIHFKGGDNPDSIYGPDYTRAVIDEASRTKPEAYYAVWSTLTATQGRLRIIGNVKGRHNWAYQLARRAESGGLKDAVYFKLTADDAVEAGIYSREVVDDAKDKLPPHVFRELFYAEPADDGGNPFGIEAIARCVKPLSTGKPVAYGIDLARAQDWTVVIGLDGTGTTCFFDRWQHVPWHETIDRISLIVGSIPALADSTGVGDAVVDQLQRRVPQVEGYHFTSQRKQVLMEGLGVAIQSGKIGYPDGPIRVELEQFEYEYTRTGVRYAAADGMHDDCVCALGLANHLLASNPGIRVYTPSPKVAVAGTIRPDEPDTIMGRRGSWMTFEGNGSGGFR